VAWPRHDPDPFPEVDGAPEITAAELDLATLGGSIEHHGCLMVRDLLSADQLALMVHDVDRAIEHGRAVLAGEEEEGATSWFAAFDHAGNRPMQFTWGWSVPKGQVATAESPRAFFDLLEILTDLGVLDLVTDYFGEPPHYLAIKGAVRRTPPDHEGGWHQDGAVYGVHSKALALWIAFTPCGPDTAIGLDLIPGHYDDLVPYESTNGLPGITDETIAEVARTRPIRRPAFDAGDAVFFNHLIPHQTGTGPGFTDDRLAVEMWFFAPSTIRTDMYPLWLGTR
jgi:hypothetical protein